MVFKVFPDRQCKASFSIVTCHNIFKTKISSVTGKIITIDTICHSGNESHISSKNYIDPTNRLLENVQNKKKTTTRSLY